MKVLYSRIGGKHLLKKRIVALFPPEFDTYIEPFFGGGSIFFSYNEKKPHKRRFKAGLIKEIINDLDDDIYAIINGIKNTPELFSNFKFNEDVFDSAMIAKDPFSLFLKYRLSFGGKGKHYNKSRDGKKMAYDYMKYAERMKNTTVLHLNAFNILEENKENPNAFFYLDPPYECTEGNTYYYAESNVKPEQILDAVKNIAGKFILSYNDSEKIRTLFKDYTLIEAETTYSCNNLEKKKRKELIIKNF